MNVLATAVPLTTRIAVHVLGVDPDRRVLLDRAQPPLDPVWGLPGTMVQPGEDPVVRVRQLISEAGALTATRVEVIDLESIVESGLHVVHMVFECGAEPPCPAPTPPWPWVTLPRSSVPETLLGPHPKALVSRLVDLYPRPGTGLRSRVRLRVAGSGPGRWQGIPVNPGILGPLGPGWSQWMVVEPFRWPLGPPVP